VVLFVVITVVGLIFRVVTAPSLLQVHRRLDNCLPSLRCIVDFCSCGFSHTCSRSHWRKIETASSSSSSSTRTRMIRSIPLAHVKLIWALSPMNTSLTHPRTPKLPYYEVSIPDHPQGHSTDCLFVLTIQPTLYQLPLFPSLSPSPTIVPPCIPPRGILSLLHLPGSPTDSSHRKRCDTSVHPPAHHTCPFRETSGKPEPCESSDDSGVTIADRDRPRHISAVGIRSRWALSNNHLRKREGMARLIRERAIEAHHVDAVQYNSIC